MTTHKNSNATKIREALTKNLNVNTNRLASALGVSVQYVYAVKHKMDYLTARAYVQEKFKVVGKRPTGRGKPPLLYA